MTCLAKETAVVASRLACLRSSRHSPADMFSVSPRTTERTTELAVRVTPSPNVGDG